MISSQPRLFSVYLCLLYSLSKVSLPTTNRGFLLQDLPESAPVDVSCRSRMTSAAGHVSNSPTVKWVIVTLENETVRGLFKVCFSARALRHAEGL